VLNGAINHYNSALSTAYNRIATLEVEVTRLWGELSRLPGGKITSKTKVPEPPTFSGLENKMQLHDWLSQIALYCSASGITVDDQKIICALICLRAPASTYMKSYYNKVQAGANELHLEMDVSRFPSLDDIGDEDPNNHILSWANMTDPDSHQQAMMIATILNN